MEPNTDHRQQPAADPRYPGMRAFPLPPTGGVLLYPVDPPEETFTELDPADCPDLLEAWSPPVADGPVEGV